MPLFLHGFLGQKEDFDPLLSHLGFGEAIDLPIGEKDIALALKETIGSCEVLIGYSAGGRIALEMKDRFPESFGKVIALSAHPGLKNETEKRARALSDQKWVDLLNGGSMEAFLEKWYAQPLFSTLKKHPQFDEMFARRITQDPKSWGQFLQRHGLGQKKAPQLFPEGIFLYGSQDLKYQKLYRKLNAIEIANCGHAVHFEKPKRCAKIIEDLIHDNI